MRLGLQCGMHDRVERRGRFAAWLSGSNERIQVDDDKNVGGVGGIRPMNSFIGRAPRENWSLAGRACKPRLLVGSAPETELGRSDRPRYSEETPGTPVATLVVNSS
jgi:hypothetical protein